MTLLPIINNNEVNVMLAVTMRAHVKGGDKHLFRMVATTILGIFIVIIEIQNVRGDVRVQLLEFHYVSKLHGLHVNTM